MSMYDYLTSVTPDYETTTLTISPQIMSIRGNKEVQINRGIGRSEERVILSDLTKFWVELKWNALSDTDYDTLFDFYHDPDKGCGIGRTFYWDPPSQYDSHIYVVRFDSNFDSFLRSYQIYRVASLILYVIGRKPD